MSSLIHNRQDYTFSSVLLNIEGSYEKEEATKTKIIVTRKTVLFFIWVNESDSWLPHL